MNPVVVGTVRHMETQHEFIERRKLAVDQAWLDAEHCPLVKARFGPHPEPVPVKRSMLYSEGFMFKRQAGDLFPLDAPVSSADTVLSVTAYKVLGINAKGSFRRSRRYPLRWFRDIRRAFLRLQQVASRLMCPAP